MDSFQAVDTNIEAYNHPFEGHVTVEAVDEMVEKSFEVVCGHPNVMVFAPMVLVWADLDLEENEK